MKNSNDKMLVSFEYDYLEDTSFFNTNYRNYKESILFEDLVFDLNDDGKVIGIEIFNTSKLLHTKKAFLNRVKTLRFEVHIDKENIEFSINMDIEIRNKLTQKNLIVSEPNIWGIKPTNIISPITA